MPTPFKTDNTKIRGLAPPLSKENVSAFSLVQHREITISRAARKWIVEPNVG